MKKNNPYFRLYEEGRIFEMYLFMAEAIENGYNYEKAVKGIQEDMNLSNEVTENILELMNDHSWEEDNQYIQFEEDFRNIFEMHMNKVKGEQWYIEVVSLLNEVITEDNEDFAEVPSLYIALDEVDYTLWHYYDSEGAFFDDYIGSNGVEDRLSAFKEVEELENYIRKYGKDYELIHSKDFWVK